MQVPARKASERDQAQIAAWKDERWLVIRSRIHTGHRAWGSNKDLGRMISGWVGYKLGET
nr:hypothetical protein [Streptomyces coacervatus]